MMFGKRFPIEQILRRSRHSRRDIRSDSAARYVRTESLEERLLLAADVADSLFNAVAFDQLSKNCF